jgi:hypothetical protein
MPRINQAPPENPRLRRGKVKRKSLSVENVVLPSITKKKQPPVKKIEGVESSDSRSRYGDVIFIKPTQVRRAMICNNLYHSSKTFESAIMKETGEYLGNVLQKSLEFSILKRSHDYKANSNFLIRLKKEDIECVDNLLFDHHQINTNDDSLKKKIRESKRSVASAEEEKNKNQK